MRYVQHIRGNWPDLKVKLKTKYNLTDDDLHFTEEKYEQMIDHVSVKLNKTRQEFIRILNNL